MNRDECYICGGNNIFKSTLDIKRPFEKQRYSICSECLIDIEYFIEKERNREAYVIGSDEE